MLVEAVLDELAPLLPLLPSNAPDDGSDGGDPRWIVATAKAPPDDRPGPLVMPRNSM